jgi:hypothetical protein
VVANCTYGFETLKRRFTFSGLIVSSTSFIVLTLVWFVLNHFRHEYYNSAVEAPSAETGPYFAIVRTQSLLVWPMICLFGLAMIMLLFEVIHLVLSKTSK